MNVGGKIAKLRKHWDWRRIGRNIKYLIKNDLSDQLYDLKRTTIEDCAYELDDCIRTLPSLRVLTGPETLELLLSQPKSFARFGDGEIMVMEGQDIAFQDSDEDLAKVLHEILAKPSANLYVGINASYFVSPFRYSERNMRFYIENASAYRRFFIENCNRDSTYLDAACFGAYFRYPESFDYDGHFRTIKSLFDNRRIVLVSGAGILEKLEYDLFSDAAEVKRVSAPTKNAWQEKDAIIRQVVNIAEKDELICLILGVAATALAYELSTMGYVAWDIGHVAKDYDAYMRNIPRTEENASAFWLPD